MRVDFFFFVFFPCSVIVEKRIFVVVVDGGTRNQMSTIFSTPNKQRVLFCFALFGDHKQTKKQKVLG